MEQNNKIKVTILFDQPFPIGMASTNRIISLSRGLIENNVKVKVLCIKPTEDAKDVINKSNNGEYKGILYRYVASSTIWPSGKFKQKLIQLFGLLVSSYLLVLYKIKDDLDVLIYPGYNFKFNILYFILSRLIKVKYVYAIDEFPKTVLDRKKYSLVYRVLFNKIHHRLFDGWVVITKTLDDFYSKYARKNAARIVIPMTVEPERFSVRHTKQLYLNEYIAYCGNLGYNNKDGLCDLLTAFSIFCKKINRLSLVVIGSSDNPEDLDKLKQLAIKLNIDDKVIFTGKVERDEMPSLLTGALALTLARPNNIQARGGFPTKLGEYLATGKPVVVTAVGDIPRFLKHRVNAFIAEPDNPVDFANKLDEVFENYKLSLEIGRKGKILANTVFNYSAQGKRLAKFLAEMLTS